MTFPAWDSIKGAPGTHRSGGAAAEVEYEGRTLGA